MFYDTFKRLCDYKGVSVTKATEEIGLARTIATKWKKTGATPRGETLVKIADYFGVSVSYLMDAEDVQPKADYEDFPEDVIKIRNILRERPEAKFLFDTLEDASAADLMEAAAVVLRRKEERNKQ